MPLTTQKNFFFSSSSPLCLSPLSAPPSTSPSPPQREVERFDVVVVGGGVAGLSAAIRLKQLEQIHNTHPNDLPPSSTSSFFNGSRTLRIAVVEKASEMGGHTLSGACVNPRSLMELFPSWSMASDPIPSWTPVTSEAMCILRAPGKWAVPAIPWVPPSLSHHGGFVGSLGSLTKWLSDKAEGLGVEIYPGFAAREIEFRDGGAEDGLRGHESEAVVEGVQLNDVGIDKNGEETDRYEPGMIFKATQTIFAEGCRGSCTKRLERRLQLRPPISSRPKHHQTYGLGIKEVWEVLPEHHRPGRIEHMVGWPLTRSEGFDSTTYGGCFLYHYGKNLVSCGLVIGLDYRHPHCSPYKEMQKWKTHPRIRAVLEGGRPVWYGARTISEGGLAALPTLTFRGGLLVGDAAGFLNLPRIQGVHTAMKSGMLAAEAIMDDVFLRPPRRVGTVPPPPHASSVPTPDATGAKDGALPPSSSRKKEEAEKPLSSEEPKVEDDSEENAWAGINCTSYPERFRKSWLYKELHQFRNVRQVFQRNFLLGLLYTGITSCLTFGKEPFTLSHGTPDHLTLRGIAEMKGLPEAKDETQTKTTSGEEATIMRKDTSAASSTDSARSRASPITDDRAEAHETPRQNQTDAAKAASLPATPPLTSRLSPGFPLKHYPPPDNKLTFDLLTSLSRSGTNHNENQPCHLRLLDESIPTSVNWKLYGGPESHFCPAGVYEYDEQGKLRINAQNCLHCKACDVKDPTQNIQWTPPEGGGGPSYHHQM